MCRGAGVVVKETMFEADGGRMRVVEVFIIFGTFLVVVGNTNAMQLRLMEVFILR